MKQPTIKRTVSGWGEVFWPVVQRRREKGWRTGHTRVYTLACGHYYSVPASRAEGKGKTAQCTFCSVLWRWITEERPGAVSVDYAVQVHPHILTEMHNLARAQGKLVREITPKEVLPS